MISLAINIYHSRPFIDIKNNASSLHYNTDANNRHLFYVRYYCIHATSTHHVNKVRWTRVNQVDVIRTIDSIKMTQTCQQLPAYLVRYKVYIVDDRIHI
jgi:hypothetical protein